MKDLKSKILDRLSYNPQNGDFKWIKPPIRHPDLNGLKAGTNREGYIIIKIDSKKYPAHRIAWLIVFGYMPKMIDHKNRNRSDNRICNLREVDNYGNTQNHSRTHNKSGLPVGVRKLGDKFQARLTYRKKVIHLGSFNECESASIAYQNKRKLLFREFTSQ